MKYLFEVVLLQLLLLPALAEDKDGRLTLYRMGNSERTLEYSIPVEATGQLPLWSPVGSVTPPLSMGSALNKALSYIEPAAKSWPVHIKSISLRHGRPEETRHIWFYSVSAYIDLDPSARIEPVVVDTVVLMDGTVLFPGPGIQETGADIAHHAEPQVHPRYANANEIKLFYQGSHGFEDHYIITKEEADSLPYWQAASGEAPPLEIDAVLRKLHDRINQNIPDQDWKFLQCSLMRGAYPESRHIWRYHINILHKPKDYEGSTMLWNHCFLMDGSMLSPDPLTVVKVRKKED